MNDTKIPAYNPYGQAARQVRALLRLEMQYQPDVREKFEWILRFDVLGTPLVVGRGGANTIFWSFGDRPRELAFPNPALAYFDRLARQPFVAYVVVAGGKKRRLFDRQKALETKPVKGAKIVGRGLDGSRTVAYTARKTVAGVTKWLPAK